MTGIQFPAGKMSYFLFATAHPTYLNGTGVSFLGDKAAGA